MKKYFNTLLVMLISITAINMKATSQEVKNQYVKWNAVPSKPSGDQVGAWLKQAMVDGKIPGALIRSEASDYTAVWGDDIYDEVLGATKFAIGPSTGGEKNYALGSSNQPVSAGVLNEGVAIIRYQRPNGQAVTIAKWGTNGCLNPLEPVIVGTAKVTNDEPDVDVATVKRTGSNNTSGNTPTNNNNNNVVNNSGMTWEQGFSAYSAGFDKRSIAMYEDWSLFAKTASISGGSNTQGWVSTGSVVSMQPAQQVIYQQPHDQAVRVKPNGLDWAMFGLSLVNTASNVYSAVKLDNIADCLCPHNRRCGSCNQCSGGFYPRGPGFQYNSGGYGGFVPITPPNGLYAGGIAQPGDLLGGYSGGGGAYYGQTGNGYGYGSGPGFGYVR